jgi:hypothetical protein
MHLIRVLIVAASAGTLLAIVGCGGSYNSSVTGIVTLDGKTVPRGTVSFQSKGGGPAAYAVIEENGSYYVQTGREGGLPAGEYYVTITANEAPATTQTSTGGPPPPGKPITPSWYRSRESSGLSFVVEPGSNKINLELTSTPPAGWSGKK